MNKVRIFIIELHKKFHRFSPNTKKKIHYIYFLDLFGRFPAKKEALNTVRP